MNAKNKKIFAIALIIIIISAGVFFFLKSSKFKDNRGMPYGGNMKIQKLTEEETSNINSFFESSPTQEEIENYCSENMSYCIYYCRENQESDYCKNLMPKNKTSSQDFNPENMPQKN